MTVPKKALKGKVHDAVEGFISIKNTQEAQEAQEELTQEAHKAEQVPEAQIAQDVKDMTAQLEAQEARKTAGRKGFKMQRLNISLTPSEFDYVRIMASITGKSQTRFIGDLISADAKRNAEAFQKAREIIENART